MKYPRKYTHNFIAIGLDLISLYFVFSGIITHDWYYLVGGLAIGIFNSPFSVIHYEGRE